MKRKPRTSGRIFSPPRFHGNMLLVGVHSTRRKAQAKIKDRIFRIDSSKVKKVGNKYLSYVHYK